MTAIPPVRISIVIPCYNRAHCIEETLVSAERQTWPDIEIIVVDDGSTDGTVDLLEKRSWSRPHTILRQANAGGGAARNAGARAAMGSWIAFLDSDDVWDARTLDKLFSAALTAGTEAAYCGMQRIDEAGNPVGSPILPEIEGDVTEALYRSNCLGGCSVMLMSRRVFDAAGRFDAAFPSCQDWDLWLRISRLTEVAAVREPLVLYRLLRTNRISTNQVSRLKGHLLMYNRHLRGPYRERPARAGRFHAILGEILALTGRARRPLAMRLHVSGALHDGGFAPWLLLLGAASLFGPRTYRLMMGVVTALDRIRPRGIRKKALALFR